jgi:hypothetical protein
MRRNLIAGCSAQRAIWGAVFALAVFALAVFGPTARNGFGQHGFGPQVNIGVNHHNVGFSYFESIGTNFGFSFPGHLNAKGHGIVGLGPTGQFTPDGGIYFGQFGGGGGGGGVIPPFGGFDPNAGLRTGWAVRGPNGGFNFGLNASQGSSTTLGGDSMSITVPNGGSGFIGNELFRPFVTGIIPVVGAGPTYLPPLTANSTQSKLHAVSPNPAAPRTGTDKSLKTGSSAERGSSSLVALRAEVAAEDAEEEAERKAEVERYVRKAKTALAEGKESIAGSYLRSAMKRATAEEREQIEATWRSK